MENSAAMSESKVLRVAVIEDEKDLRQGLAALLELAPGFRAVGAYASFEEALSRLASRPCDAALVDLGLPGMTGLEGIPRLKRLLPSAAIVVFSVYEDPERIFEALSRGACGYLLKSTSPEKLLEGLREAVAGGAPMTPAVAHRVLAEFRGLRRPLAEHDLTAAELAVLGKLVEGHNYRTAAAALGSSVNTVAFHVKHIYEKLHVHSKSEAVGRALRDRLVP